MNAVRYGTAPSILGAEMSLLDQRMKLQTSIDLNCA